MLQYIKVYILQSRHNGGPIYLLVLLFYQPHNFVSITQIDMTYVCALEMGLNMTDVDTFLLLFLLLPHTHFC